MVLQKITKEQFSSIVEGDYILAMGDHYCWGIYKALSKGWRAANVVPIDSSGDLYSEDRYFQYEEQDDYCNGSHVFMRDIQAIFKTEAAARMAYEALCKMDKAFEEETRAARLKYELGVLSTIEQNS